MFTKSGVGVKQKQAALWRELFSPTSDLFHTEVLHIDTSIALVELLPSDSNRFMYVIFTPNAQDVSFEFMSNTISGVTIPANQLTIFSTDEHGLVAQMALKTKAIVPGFVDIVVHKFKF